MINRVFKHICMSIIFFSSFYLAYSFIEMDFNSTNWEGKSRGVVVWLSIVCTLLNVISVSIKGSSHNVDYDEYDENINET